MLEYDNSAFYYFLLSILAIFLIPSYFYITSKVYGALFSSDETMGAVVRTSLELEKSKAIKNETRSLKTLVTPFFVGFCLATLICTILCVALLFAVWSNSEIQTFNPYTLLSISPGATIKEIKSAYRRKSLIYHPDKNIGDQEAGRMFMMIAKAYESLTDETARSNYEKYGNPDGKQSLEISIGLPTFLLSSEHKLSILMCYLFLMCVLIPFVVYMYYSDSSKYGEHDILFKTWAWLVHALPASTHVRLLPEVLGGCAEYHERIMPKSEQEKKLMEELVNKYRSEIYKPRYNHLMVVKGNLLIHSHLLRIPLTEQFAIFKDDLDFILKGSSRLVEAMIEHCHMKSWLEPVCACIEFNQCLTQGVWYKDSPLLQLPHFTENETRHCEGHVKTLKEYINLPSAERKGLKNFTDEQKLDINEACKIIPNMNITAEVLVEDDEDPKVYNGDLITLLVKLDRTNLREGEKAGLVHAPRFPLPKVEAWWVICTTQDKRIITIEKIVSDVKTPECRIKMMAPPIGHCKINIIVKSNCYVSLDENLSVEFDVLDASKLPAYKVHPDDKMLDEEPTLFEQMMAGNVDEDSSDDEEEKKEIEGKKKGGKKVKKSKKIKSVAGGSDDSSDDSSGSESDSDSSDDEKKKK